MNPAPTGSCNLGNGVQHVINIVFDNVHFFRDNPNVPSDLELMPHLKSFLQDNGVLMSNEHTPLIAHTAEDSVAIYTGLYGDRHGMPISNSYRTYNPNGTTDPAGSFVYWTDPINDTAGVPTAGHDPKQSMIYSPTVPAAATNTNVTTPAPWVPFTRAGCNVGDVSTANMVLENAAFDIPKVFGPLSPETAQLNADARSFKDAETADYARPRRCTAPRRRRVLRQRAGGQVRPGDRRRTRRSPTRCPTSPAATPASRRCSATSTSSRCSGARPT